MGGVCAVGLGCASALLAGGAGSGDAPASLFGGEGGLLSAPSSDGEQQEEATDLSGDGGTKVGSQGRMVNAFSIDNLLASRYRSLDSKMNIKVEDAHSQ